MKDTFKIRGSLTITHRGADGEEKSKTETHNIITNAGIAEVTALMGNVGSPTAFTYLALGSSSTAVSATDTTLTTEITTGGLARAAATVTQETTTVSNDTLQLDKTWTATIPLTVEECGVFNDATTGDMLGHALTTTKALLASDTIQVTYKVTLS
jgi:hypothetical protein